MQCVKCKLDIPSGAIACGKCETPAPAESPGVIGALQAIGSILIILGTIGGIYVGIKAASNTDGIVLAELAGSIGGIISGLLLMAVATMIEKLHRIVALLERGA